jgi:hypothetical protein
MKKKIISFLVFWMIFSLLFCSLNLATRTENNRWSEFYHLPKDSLDIVFIGNSHTYTAMQPMVIDDILSTHSYVLGVSAESIVVSYYELKELLRTQHPDVVVLETFTLDIDDTETEPQYFQFLDAGRLDTNKLAVATHYLSLDTAYSVFPALRSRMDWSNPEKYIDGFTQEIEMLWNPQVDDELGYSTRPNVIDMATYTDLLDAKEPIYQKSSDEVGIYLEKFYDLCQKNNIQLVLSTTPIVSLSVIPEKVLAPYDIDPFAEEHNIPRINYERGQFNELHFYDGTHLDKFGSLIVSVEIARELASIMHVLVNQDALAYYEAFFFSGYSLKQDGNQFSIELFPADTTAPLAYQWKLIHADSGEAVGSKVWSPDSYYEFEISEDGVYDLTCVIRQPTGDYSLSATFQLRVSD